MGHLEEQCPAAAAAPGDHVLVAEPSGDSLVAGQGRGRGLHGDGQGLEVLGSQWRPLGPPRSPVRDRQENGRKLCAWKKELPQARRARRML